jgi:hypothetical protein
VPDFQTGGIEHFRAKWTPVRVKKMRQKKNKAFSSEVDRCAASREENASKQKYMAPFRFSRNGNGS